MSRLGCTAPVAQGKGLLKEALRLDGRRPPTRASRTTLVQRSTGTNPFNGQLRCMAIDRYTKVEQIIAALTATGEAYTYDGASAMLKQEQARVRLKVPALKNMPLLGFRDLKG